MLVQRQSSPVRLPPEPGGFAPPLSVDPGGFGPPLSADPRFGNAMLQDMLRQRRGPMPGEVRAQGFEGIGESDDEVPLFDWTPFPEAQKGPLDFATLRGVRDDASLKFEGGMAFGPRCGLVSGSGQVGAWEDDEGHWNIGAGVEGGVVHGGVDLWGDSSDGGGPYLRVDGSLIDGSASVRGGTDGFDAGASFASVDIGVSGGTGFSPDSPYDFSARVSGGHGMGGDNEMRWSDVDEDGVPELNLAANVEWGPGFGVEMSSEVPMGLLQAGWGFVSDLVSGA